MYLQTSPIPLLKPLVATPTCWRSTSQNVQEVEGMTNVQLEIVFDCNCDCDWPRERPRTWRSAIERLNRRGLPIRWANRM
jgi:hypothetical protein